MLWSLAARAGIPAARSALSFLSKLKKPPSGGITRVWRGMETKIPKVDYPGPAYPKGLKGRFFTSDLDIAKWYARRKGTKSGLVQYLDLPKKQFNIGTKLSTRLKIPRLSGQVIIPKKYLTSGDIKTDSIKTMVARLRAILGQHLNTGGLARILEV
tara:strand:+ start:107 stop:574 length:468 start_codon:yes stop_codon:yes gene_type:complete